MLAKRMPYGANRRPINNRSNKLGGSNAHIRVQTVYSEPCKILVGSYLTKKGQKLKLNGATQEELNKYRKNRYKINPNATPIKTIYHNV
jgi:hypothetical protein